MTGTDKAASQQWIAVLSFLGLISPGHQYCVGKICNASPRANAHKLQNDPFTISSSVLRTHFCPESKHALPRWRYISYVHCADESQEGRNSCPLFRSCLIGSCHVVSSKGLSRGISLALYCLSLHIFWLIRSLVDPTLRYVQN